MNTLRSELTYRLTELAQRQMTLRLRKALAATWLGCALVGAIGLLAWHSPVMLAIWLAATGAATWKTFGRVLAHQPDVTEMARRIEQRHPQVKSMLEAAAQQRVDPETKQLGYLQEQVIQLALRHAEQADWLTAVPEKALRQAGWMRSGSAGLIIGLIFACFVPGWSISWEGGGLISKLALPADDLLINPGDVAVERNAGLVVTARFNQKLPPDVWLLAGADERHLQRIPMSKNLDDPIFGGMIGSVEKNMIYRVEYQGRRTRPYQVTVYDHPALQRADATIEPPRYLNEPAKTIEDTRSITAVEGSRIQLKFRLNKPVKSAQLTDGKRTVELKADPNDPTLYTAQFAAEESKKLDLKLVDADERTNKDPTPLSLEVHRNLPPTVKLLFPRKDVSVSPLEEVNLAAEASDDHGLAGYGVAWSLGSEPVKEIALGAALEGKEKKHLDYQLAMETLKVQPDDLVSYYFWAEDVGPDGAKRRAATDMYFAEVRHFEEIFREGVSPPGEESEPKKGSDSAKLLEVQKQIVSATWKLQQRVGSTPQLGEPETADTGVIRDSQSAALDMGEKAMEKLKDEQMVAALKAAMGHMTTARQKLASAAESHKTSDLASAVPPEQAAYQSLLKLRAREHQITRSKSKSKSMARNQRQQQELDQLELKKEDRRYETETEASDPKKDAADAEDLQILNRLRELARRQADLNEKLKEIAAALQEAKTEQEKEKLQKELARLQEQQQQMLRDIDELKQRMEQPENQSRMAEQMKQLDQTRQQANQANQAMEQGRMPQAVSSATRTQRQLQELRDDFRKRTSARFSDEARQLRQDARELAENQRKINQQMKEQADTQKKSLSDDGATQRAAEQLQDQRRQLDNVQKQMQKLAEASEQSEPLLHKRLYDALRQAAAQQLDQKLDMTGQMLRYGANKQARDMEQQAGAGIHQLKDQVEKAAESVLGDEASALRLAKAEVQKLTEQLNKDAGEQSEGNQPDSKSTDSKQGKSAAQAGGKSDKKGEPRQIASAEKGKGKGQSSPEGESKEAQPDPDGKPGEGDQPGQPGRQGQPRPEGQSKQGEGNGKQGDGKQPGKQSDKGQPGKGQGKGGQPGEGQPHDGQQPGRQPGDQPGDQPGRQGQGGNNPQPGNDPRDPMQRGQLQRGPGNPNQRGGRFFDQTGGNGDNRGPLTGDEFRQWSDRLREVEEMLDDPNLRRDVATIRGRAASMRAEFKRHSVAPEFESVRKLLIGPLNELHDRLSAELARKQSDQALAPIDRDPVPGKYADMVKRYYQQLGGGK